MPFTKLLSGIQDFVAFSGVHPINKWEDKWRWLFSLFSYGKKLPCRNKNVCSPKKHVYSLTFPKPLNVNSKSHHPVTIPDRIAAPIKSPDLWREHLLQKSWQVLLPRKSWKQTLVLAKHHREHEAVETSCGLMLWHQAKQSGSTRVFVANPTTVPHYYWGQGKAIHIATPRSFFLV